jgi:glutamine phosphoribosylpyrophosphate amidotransferase
MCGIVGILGRELVTGSLVDARLEYRGYDSAGIATLENGQLACRRAEGKLRNLEVRLARDPLTGTIGIGHTRWGPTADRPKATRTRTPPFRLPHSATISSSTAFTASFSSRHNGLTGKPCLLVL